MTKLLFCFSAVQAFAVGMSLEYETTVDRVRTNKGCHIIPLMMRQLWPYGIPLRPSNPSSV